MNAQYCLSGDRTVPANGVVEKMRFLLFCTTLCGCVFTSGWALQMQCYHCEEYLLENDCSAPQFIVNCTANIQNACQKEILVGTNGVSYRKACASFSTCLIVSAGYQSFCSPGRVGSVCISCCNTPLCNGPRPPRISSAPAPCPSALALLASLLPGLLGPPL
ncbi:ly6/PLAUR domain-containing protein 1-like isoform X1 [Lepisosteus oculatus]|uniref:ly6/PLAUR domain-containing protein 1-like isoform X1 n=1 Tax=Lepisosteus oculatus TaxID=7918 RepID=UPI0007400A45|nr:PREDICTED: ly6/PLAUR domain-containing protein 1-like isoform X2 [Lepisosteus oculatus]